MTEKLIKICEQIENNKIGELNLYANNIDAKGTKSISQSLKINTTLTNLDLGGLIYFYF
jgi:hypothetical protein